MIMYGYEKGEVTFKLFLGVKGLSGPEVILQMSQVCITFFNFSQLPLWLDEATWKKLK